MRGVSKGIKLVKSLGLVGSSQTALCLFEGGATEEKAGQEKAAFVAIYGDEKEFRQRACFFRVHGVYAAFERYG